MILLFFAYSLLGWCIEVTLKYFQFHRFINRGFFTGPILPIYGSGAALITLIVGELSRFESGYGTTFALSFLICGTLEYLTSYCMEKRFHARWWDYSQKPMNLHGRVWIGNLILFGIGGVAIIHLINPFLDSMISKIPITAKGILSIVLLGIFAVDYVMTHFILKLVRIGVEKSEADNTEEINREIRLLLSDRSVFHRRFAEAYPEVIYTTNRINARIAAVKAEAERLRQEAEKKVMDTLEPSGMIKNTIISKQSELISRCYDEKTADDDMIQLKAEIDAEKERLSSRPLSRMIP